MLLQCHQSDHQFSWLSRSITGFYTHPHTHSKHAHTHSHSHTHINKQTHPQTHKHTQRRAHTHAHTYVLPLRRNESLEQSYFSFNINPVCGKCFFPCVFTTPFSLRPKWKKKYLIELLFFQVTCLPWTSKIYLY